ncbi:5-methylcytosine restriction system specificity protein McrC [Burkholderia sp. BCC1985]|uniref:5-methylcytosine restriction system specificity protein McrC n=1 Tax=Burkholderia sp. BCC1985 TaxID=2817442 RepID=UPI002AAFE30B|nr:hypothetical protein [Burkholderia sp. BCC1985]
MQTIVVDGRGVLVHAFNPLSLGTEDEVRLRRLLDWRYEGEAACYRVRRRQPHKIGRVRLGSIVFSVVPDMPARDFTIFFLYSLGVSIKKFAHHETSPITLALADAHVDFDVLAATLMASACEDLAQRYLARTYQVKHEKVIGIRGGIDWSRFFSKPASVGIPCTFPEISQDNLLNRVVLAGLETAQRLKIDARLHQRLSKLRFAWASIASEQHIRLQDLEAAEKKINRLTEPYRLVLALCRMLMFGFAPEDLFGGREADFQCLEFDLSLIFERFILRLMSEAFSDIPIAIEYQFSEKDALLDGSGQVYQTTRPDYLLMHKGRPLAVVDAKYKPRYVFAPSQKRFSKENRLSENDIYQTLFYAQRAKQLALGRHVLAFVIAPKLDIESALPDEDKRTIRWVHPGEEEIVIRVLEVDIPQTVHAIYNDLPIPEGGVGRIKRHLSEELAVILREREVK